MSITQPDEIFQGARPTRIFRFIVSEMVRLQAEVNERRISHWQLHDALSAIHLPSGRRHTIGRHAERKLYELARNAIEKSDDLNGKVDASDLVKEFKIEIGKEIEAQTGQNGTADRQGMRGTCRLNAYKLNHVLRTMHSSRALPDCSVPDWPHSISSQE